MTRHHRRVLRRLARLAGIRLVCMRVAESMLTGAIVRRWEVRAWRPWVMAMRGAPVLGRGHSRRAALAHAERIIRASELQIRAGVSRW